MSAPALRLAAPSRPVRAMDRMRNNWWADTPTRCADCGGRLLLDPPQSGEPGRIVCLLCARAPYEVTEHIREPLALDEPLRRRRPPRNPAVGRGVACPHGRDAWYARWDGGWRCACTAASGRGAGAS